VLEHLFDPESAMSQLSEALHPDGIIVGGSPTTPELLRRFHEPWLRRKYGAVLHDVHVSSAPVGHYARSHQAICSSQSVRDRIDDRHFFCRWTSLLLENSKLWLRANLLWGAAAPALGGEMYFALRPRQEASQVVEPRHANEFGAA
jgi:hypothetical protein